MEAAPCRVTLIPRSGTFLISITAIDSGRALTWIITHHFPLSFPSFIVQNSSLARSTLIPFSFADRRPQTSAICATRRSPSPSRAWPCFPACSGASGLHRRDQRDWQPRQGRKTLAQAASPGPRAHTHRFAVPPLPPGEGRGEGSGACFPMAHADGLKSFGPPGLGVARTQNAESRRQSGKSSRQPAVSRDPSVHTPSF